MVSILQDINTLQNVLPTPITLLGDDQALLSPFPRGNNIGLSALLQRKPGIAVYSHYIKFEKFPIFFQLQCLTSFPRGK